MNNIEEYLNSNLLEKRLDLMEDIYLLNICTRDYEPFIPYFYNILSSQEREQEKKMVNEVFKKKYIVRRGLLRFVLARFINIQPTEVDYYYNQYGKPYLKNKMQDKDIYFNISHSDDCFIIGISQCVEIGVDIEKKNKIKDIQALTNIVFSNNEKRIFSSLKEPDSIEKMFYHVWTVKEAVSKALGIGLSIGLDNINICDTDTGWFQGSKVVQSNRKLLEIVSREMENSYIAVSKINAVENINK